LALSWHDPYYTLLAMEMNVAQYPAPKNAAKLARFPEP
jgi:4-carboxymuconolactone decarboxylase